ncbi:MAG TPA: BON domain-containing protein [Roseateles sp.]
MRTASSSHADDDWRDRLPPYGETREPAAVPVRPRLVKRDRQRRRVGILGWLIALGLGAGIAALMMSNQDDPRTIGKQLDDAIANVRATGDRVGQTVVDSQSAAVQASRNVVEGVGTAIDDTGISLKVKTALAADPALSASRIMVTTRDGIVRLEGPSPDAAAKARATVLASAPQGVRGVDNRLTLPQQGRVVAVAEGAAPLALATAAAASAAN